MSNKIQITKTCNLCQQKTGLWVQPKDYAAWQGGAHIQDVMPYLPADQRELLISGTCGTCFDKLFPEDEYDEDEVF